MQNPNLPAALGLAGRLGLDLNLEHATYYLARETLIPSAKAPGMALWRESSLRVQASRNALRATAYFHIPPERVVEIGTKQR